MSFYYLSSKLNEETTEDAISFLPCHVGKLNQHLQKLALKKLDWGLEVQESDSGFLVRFGDGTIYSVAKKDWGLFQESLRKVSEANAENHLEKSFSGIKQKVFQALKDFYSRGEIKRVSELIQYWKKLFPNTKYLKFKKPIVAVTYQNKEEDIQQLYKDLISEYGSDRGTLEIMLGEIQRGESPTVLEGFKNYKFIYGIRAISFFQSQKLILEVMIDSFETVFVTVEVSGELAEVLEENTVYAKRIKNTFFPDFKNLGAFFRTIKSTILDL
jgi:hypothetical protein